MFLLTENQTCLPRVSSTAGRLAPWGQERYTQGIFRKNLESFVQRMRSRLVSTPCPKCSGHCAVAALWGGATCSQGLDLVWGPPRRLAGVLRGEGHMGILDPLNRRWKWSWAIWSPRAQAPSGGCLTLITRLTGVVRYHLSLIKCSLLFSTLNVTFTNMTKGQISCPWCISKCQAYKSILGEFVPRNYILVLSTVLN